MKKRKREGEPVARERKRTQRKWNKKLVKDELLALHEKGCEMREREIREIDGGLVSAARRHYGSWVKALTAAGIRPCYISRRKWTEEMVLREIALRMERGESLRAVDVNRDNQKLYRNARELFGSYIEAVESLGVDYADFGPALRRWKKEEIKSEIKRLFKAGKPLNAGWVGKNENALYLAAKKEYGSWDEALGSIGIDYEEIRQRKKWSPDGVKERIREMYKAGDRLDAAYVLENDKRLFYAGHRLFGGWEKTVSAAGVDYEKVRVDRRKKWSRKMIVEKIRDMEKKGAKLNHAAAAQKDRNLVAAAMRHFGSWRAALEAAGINYKDVCGTTLNWTEDDVSGEIKRLNVDGADLVSTVMCRENSRLFRAGVARFGTWEKAVRAAGIDYDRYRKIRMWNREKVMESLQERMKRGKSVTWDAVKKEDSGLYVAVYDYFKTWDEAVRAARDNQDFKETLSRVGAKTSGIRKNTRWDGRRKNFRKGGMSR